MTGTTLTDRGTTGINGALNGSIALGAIPFPAGGRAPWWSGSDATTTNILIADNAAWSPHAGASGVATLEYWFWQELANYSASGETGRFIHVYKGNAIGNQYEYYNYNNNATLLLQISQLGGAAVSNVTSAVFRAAAWNHVVMVYDRVGAVMIGYLNGQEFARTSSFTSTSSDGTGGLYIGGKNDASGRFSRGSLAHVAIYNKALAHTRIAAHYRAGTGRQLRRRVA